MSTPRLLPSLGLLAAVSVLVAVPATAQAKSSKCSRAGSATIVQTKKVRVYEVERGETTTMYGCRKENGRQFKLDNASDDGFTSSDTYDTVQIAGYQVAWKSTLTDTSCRAACPPGEGLPKVRIAVQSILSGASRSVPAAPIGEAIVVSRKGSLAWAAQGSSSGVVDLHASLADEEDNVIDSGNIDPESLDVEISIISWIRDGVEHFARLR